MASQARVSPPAQQSGHVVRDSALGRVPETVDAFVALNRDVWRRGPLPPALLELARLTNARHVNCVFCKAVRYDVAREDGLTEDKIARLDQADPAGFSEREKLVVAFTRQYLNAPAELPDDLRASMLEHFSAEEIVHLALAVGTFNAFSKCAVSLGGMPDELPPMEMSVPD